MTQSSIQKLILNKGTASAQEFELTQSEIIIGREPEVDITIPAPGISRRHAKLTQGADGYTLEDLGSSNGTFVNGAKLTGQRLLKSGDQVRLGQAVNLVYEAPPPIAPTPPKQAANAATAYEAAPPIAPTPPKQVNAATVFRQPIGSMQTVFGMEAVKQSEASEPPQLVIAVAGGSSQTHTLTRPNLTIGRVEDNDIVVPSQVVSRQHARLEAANGGYKLVVAPEAKNPILFEGRPLEGSRVLHHGDMFRIGSLDPGMMVTLTYNAPSEASQQIDQDIVFGEKTLIQIGRDPTNDVVVPSPNVSRFHSQIQKVGQRYRVEDLRSSNGTFVNGERVDGSMWLKPDDSIRVGQYRFVMGKDQLASYDDSNGLTVDVVGLNKWVRPDLNILQNISVAFKPREFIVVVGQSGGGKSTFVDAVAGYRPATPPSKVYVNDIDIYTHFDSIRNEIGFVPQKDIIHMELTIYQALDYAAQLRMPADTSPEERHKRVMEVLADLDLTHRKEVQISGLSGGQQKRVSIGVELLTKPGLFFLDEPTSGLDPGTETALMQLMRRLADQGRTIILITHATKNVMLADKVIFLARGGYLAWFGPPDEALTYFDQHRSERERRAGRIEFDEIYAILDNPNKGKAEDWAKQYRESKAYQEYVAKPLAGKMSPEHAATVPQPAQALKKAGNTRQVSSIRQFMILSARNIKILTRDRFALGLMLATAPLVSMLDVVLALVMGRNPFDFNEGDMAQAMITLFLMTIYGIMVGGISQMREIVKEGDIYKRERLVNLKILPYVLSKVWVAGLLALYQAAVYTIVHYLAFKMPGGVLEFLQIYITMALATFAGMMLGLFASALAPNASSAPLLVIMLMLPQIVLGRALVPVPGFVSAPTSTRWAFEALISITGAGSDVAADVCWALPEEDRNALTLEDKLTYGCKCMGLNMLDQESCNHPGLGKWRVAGVGESLPVEPLPLGDPPAEPVIPEQPVQPADQSDNIAMAEYFTKLQEWEDQATVIQENYKRELSDYQARAETYQSDRVAYETARGQMLVAVAPAEGVVRTFYNGTAWAYVDKEDPLAYYSKIGFTWFVQFLICLILLVAILYLQKRKDVI
ncbi:MAG: FHA domain-containing protein [Anaerolineales bacterium]|nr:FHA domain-containing protein [Anaerolineales bacterium]